MKTVVLKAVKKICISTVVMIVVALPVVGYGFDMNDMNKFYQTRQCPKCDLSYGTFLRLKAPEANLLEGRCKGVSLSYAILDRADFSDADFSDAKLFGADLRNARLQRTNLAGADLIIADLRGADLSKANLAGANLKGANLAGAKIEGADFSGATWPDWDKCKQGSIGECKK